MFNRSRYVILKDGNNKSLVIGLLTVSTLIALCMMLKIWAGDEREISSKNLDDPLHFAMAETKVNEYYWNKEDHIAEVWFTETRSSDKGQYKLKYTAVDEDGNELPMNIIYGNAIKGNEDDVKSTVDVIIQFSTYKDFYNVGIVISQENMTDDIVKIDYRDMVLKEIKEKGKDYVVNLNKEEQILFEYKKDMEEKEAKFNVYRGTLDVINENKQTEYEKLYNEWNEARKLFVKQNEKVKALRGM